MIPLNFFLLAERLLENENCAEGLRTAIGRAYYAAFNEAKGFLQSISGVHVSGGPTGHGEVRHHFVDLGDPEMETIGNDLATLHSKRIKADYDLADTSVESVLTATFYVQLAKGILGKIGACKSSSSKLTPVSSAIKKRNTLLREGPPSEKKS